MSQPHEIVDKIVGLVYGCALGEAASDLFTSDGVVENATAVDMLDIHMKLDNGAYFDSSGFVQRLKVYSGRDDVKLSPYMNDVISANMYVVSPAETAMKIMNAQDDDVDAYDTYLSNDAVVRAAFVGIFSNWDSYSVMQCMCTHVDHRCIAASVMISSLVRNIILGSAGNVSDVIPYTLQYIVDSGKMTDEMHKAELMHHLSKDVCSDINNINTTKNPRSAMTAMSVGVHSIFTLTNSADSADSSNDTVDTKTGSDKFVDILKSIVGSGGDIAGNCSVAGAIMGCELGYSGLPTELVDRLSKKTDLANMCLAFVKKLSLVSSACSTIEEAVSPVEPSSNVAVSPVEPSADVAVSLAEPSDASDTPLTELTEVSDTNDDATA
jgi:ADP-ribosylglycohydrolase